MIKNETYSIVIGADRECAPWAQNLLNLPEEPRLGAMFTTVAMEFRPSNTRCGLERRCVGAGMGFTTLIEQID